MPSILQWEQAWFGLGVIHLVTEAGVRPRNFSLRFLGVFSLPPSKDEARINPNRSNSYIQNPRNPRTPRSRLCHISIMYTRTTYIHTYPYMHAHTQTKQLSTTQDCVFADEVQLCEASFHFRLEIAIRACSLDHLPAPSI